MLASTRPRPPRAPRNVAIAFGAACDCSSLCAIVLALTTGSVMSRARSSRCIAATSAAASPDVRAMIVVGGAPVCVYER